MLHLLETETRARACGLTDGRTEHQQSEAAHHARCRGSRGGPTLPSLGVLGSASETVQMADGYSEVRTDLDLTTGPVRWLGTQSSSRSVHSNRNHIPLCTVRRGSDTALPFNACSV